jgi:hemolysin III
MKIFQLKQLQSLPRNEKGVIRWDFDRAELIADGVVHIIGLVFCLIAATTLLVLTGIYASAKEIVSVSIYVIGLLAMFGFSASYNLWPVSPAKWWLRRFDHSAIYVLIAATYTPFLAQMNDRFISISLLVGVWVVAIAGVWLKIARPGRFDKLSVVLYLALGWSGLMAYDTVIHSLSTSTLFFIAAGGILYSLGVIFHAWERLRFQNAIWHSFVLLAAACHYTAVLDMVLISS